MDGEEVIGTLEDEIARVVKIIQGPVEPVDEAYVTYNKGYLEGLEYAVSEIRALD